MRVDRGLRVTGAAAGAECRHSCLASTPPASLQHPSGLGGHPEHREPREGKLPPRRVLTAPYPGQRAVASASHEQNVPRGSASDSLTLQASLCPPHTVTMSSRSIAMQWSP